MFFAATSLLPLSSTAGEPTHRSSTARLLYGWSWGGIQVYDLKRGVILGGLSVAAIIPRGFVLGKTNAFVLAGRTVYDYRIGSLTATRTLPVGSDSLIGETDGYPILQSESMVLVKDMSGRTISAAPADGGPSSANTATFDSMRHRVATAWNDRVQIWDTANGHLTNPRRIVVRADFHSVRR